MQKLFAGENKMQAHKESEESPRAYFFPRRAVKWLRLGLQYGVA